MLLSLLVQELLRSSFTSRTSLRHGSHGSVPCCMGLFQSKKRTGHPCSIHWRNGWPPWRRPMRMLAQHRVRRNARKGNHMSGGDVISGWQDCVRYVYCGLTLNYDQSRCRDCNWIGKEKSCLQALTERKFNFFIISFKFCSKCYFWMFCTVRYEMRIMWVF